MLKPFRIGRRGVGPGLPAFVIAEAGVNHNGSLELACRLVREARRAGADCVKFQTFTAEGVATAGAPKARYQIRSTGRRESQLDMLRKLELSPGDHRALKRLADREGILFMSTPYGFEDADFLESLGVPAYKLASMHLVEPAFIRHVAGKGKPVILSTGMGTLAEVRAAVRAFRTSGNPDLVLLQCNTNYPSASAESNLRAIPAMREALGVLTGYSDHTESVVPAVVSVGLGACVIEKHFTLDRAMAGPDHRCSLDPRGFAGFVRAVREAEGALGDGVKRPYPAERANAKGMRRSIVAAEDIPAGARLSLRNVTLKRPGTGLLGKDLDRVLGRRARRRIARDERIRPGALA